MRRQKHREPAHPGRILREYYIKPLNLTITKLAETLSVSIKALSAIVNEKKRVTPDMALRLAMAFGKTPEFWWNLQNNYDLYLAQQRSTEWQKIPKINMELSSV
ncbi:MAG: HigA family addiction module antitoxin [Thermodesulfobacteriota bacterium]|nr:HigA family addiction module antitoxin [Thermodesulfobacteriota bacterium]